MKRQRCAVIIGNRDFFPDFLVTEGRTEILAALAAFDVEPVILDANDTKLGSVETYAHARRCAELFTAQRDSIDGVIVSLPNFGDEKGVCDALKLSGLRVPILVQAFPDDLDRLDVARRRDAFCGKVSVCNVLRQFGMQYTLTQRHTVRPADASFRADLGSFLATCRVVNGLRRARIGAIGARPNAFNTTRYSEKLLEATGVSVSTIDLSEILGRANRMADDDARVAAIRAYADASAVPEEALKRMAKLAAVIEDWMQANDLAATAVQCWNSLQENYGVNVCTVMSMLSERLLPSACEVDVAGAVSMYALQLASGTPAALVDWNNNYGGDPNKCVLFHCGNWAKSFVPAATLGTAPILGSTLGEQRTWGTVNGRAPVGPLTYARVSTDDCAGLIRAFVGEGAFTDDPLATFGARAVVEVPKLQRLMRHICRNGFEHHAAMSASHCAPALNEAFGNYLGWDVYYHQAPELD